MTMVRKVYVLTEDVDNTDKRARKGPLQDMPEMFMEGDVFVHEVVAPQRGGKKGYDALLYLDDDDVPLVPFERGTKMYDKLWKHLKRAKPGLGRLLHEYNAFMPHTVSEILGRIVSSELITLRQLEDTLIAYRRANDYDMLDEDDTIALPKKGRSKLDKDEGRTDPTRGDFDPDMSGYVDPEDEDDDDGEDEAEDEAALREAEEAEEEAEDDEGDGPYQTWKSEVDALFRARVGTSWADLAGGEEPLQQGWEAGDEPQEFVDWFIDKHDLQTIDQGKPRTPKEDTSIEAKLHAALHTVEDADKRWAMLKERGATDDELQVLIGREFGDGGGSMHGGWTTKGGKSPKFWDSMFTSGKKATLSGKRLLKAVRALLNIGLPEKKGRGVAKPKAKKKQKVTTPKKSDIAELAEQVYEVLAQTPGKTRKLSTLAEMTGAKSARDVYLAMDHLAAEGRVDNKGRAVIGKGD